MTGAASGIGLGIAEVFVEQGATLIIADRHNDAGQAIARKPGKNATFTTCDVADENSVNAMVQATLDAHGRIDVLVNNAGVNFSKPFEQLTAEDWDRVTHVNSR